jgi:hypothetical protein
MKRLTTIIVNLVFCIQVLLIFLWFAEDRIDLPVWLQVAGRLHPLMLHIPIGLLVVLVLFLLIQNQFEERSAEKILLILSLLTSLTASVTALLGFFLSLQGDYDSDLFFRHKISGIVLSFLCYAILLVFLFLRKRRSILYFSGSAALILMIVAGHSGGSLTHGENFIFEPVNRDEILTLNKDEETIYRLAVEPILSKKCFSCHNESKKKGGLVMTSEELFIKGGKQGKEWMEGNPLESRLMQMIHLPIAHDEHMPPDGKPQLTEFEIHVLNTWIQEGASFDLKMNDLPDSDTLKMLTAAMITTVLVDEEKYTFKAASMQEVERLNTPFCSVFPLYRESPALQADFFVRNSFKSSALDALESVKDQLVILNLSGMPVDDEMLTTVGKFKNLEKLNLNFTAINGPGLAKLSSLEKLQTISLTGTTVARDHLKFILDLPSLTELYVWNTGVTEKDVQDLQREYPAITFVLGRQAKDEEILRLSPPVLSNEGVIRAGEEVVLKHSMPGVTIRYTLDGTDPDSVSSNEFEAPIALKTTTRIKAIACKESWYCSDEYEVTCFVEGIRPDTVVLLANADPQYKGIGAVSLTDGRKGFVDILKEPSWLGFRNDPFAAEFQFDVPRTVTEITISYGKNIGAYLFPPEEVEIFGSDSDKKWKLIKRVRPEQPVDYLPSSVEGLSFFLDEPAAYSFYKIIAKPVSKLPSWHSGKGDKGWIFVDEVFFY